MSIINTYVFALVCTDFNNDLYEWWFENVSNKKYVLVINKLVDLLTNIDVLIGLSGSKACE